MAYLIERASGQDRATGCGPLFAFGSVSLTDSLHASQIVRTNSGKKTTKLMKEDDVLSTRNATPTALEIPSAAVIAKVSSSVMRALPLHVHSNSARETKTFPQEGS